MAIRIRKGKNKPYQVYWRNPRTGRQESKAFSTMLEARKYEAEIKYRIECQPETFKAEAERSERSAANHTEVFCLEDVFIAYLREKQFSQQRIGLYMCALKIPLEQLGRKAIDAITEQDLAVAVTSMYSQDVMKTTAGYYAKLFFAVLHWAKRKHFIREAPLLPELPTAHCRHFVPPTQAEMSKLYAVAAPHIRRVIVLGSKLGMRVGPCEMFRLKWSDFDFARNVCRVPAADKNKAEPWREVPIQPAIMPLLKEWQAADAASGIEFVVHRNDGKPMKSIRWTWESALRKAGIGRHIRPYDLRHAFATDAIAGGADVGTVAKLMGHANANMVLRHYQHVLTAQKQAAINALPELPLYDRDLYAQEKTGCLQ